MKTKLVLVALLFVLTTVGPAFPDERKAIATAKCVRTAIKAGLADLPDEPDGKLNDQQRAALRAGLDAVNRKKTVGVKKCLNEGQAYELGWFSFLEDMQFLSKCRLRKTKALDNFRWEDDGDTDLISGAAFVADLNTEADLEKHPFIRGQNEAREWYGDRVSQSRVCDDLLVHFGPAGNRFGGLVKR